MRNGLKSAAESNRARAFTLIELLLAMAILVVIVMLVSQIFNQAMVAWDSGQRKADVNFVGRALVDFMAQEISKAVYDGKLYNAFVFPPTMPYALFITLDKTPNNSNRTVRLVKYDFVAGYNGLGSIMRTTRKWNNGFLSGVMYSNITWGNAWPESSAYLCPLPVAGRNQAFVKSLNYYFPAGYSYTSGLPAYVDIAIEVVRLEDDVQALPGTVSTFESRAWMKNRQRCRND